MKTLRILTTIFILNFGWFNLLYGQITPPNDLISADSLFGNYHGLKVENNAFMEGEGVEIVIRPFKEEANEKNFQKIKKKLMPKALAINEELKDIPKPYQAFQYIDNQGDSLQVIQTFFVLSAPQGGILAIGFAALFASNLAKQKEMVRSIYFKGIPEKYFTPLIINYLDFVGRTIELGGACEWMSPHNVQCSGYGQINWSLYPDLKTAELMRDLQLKANQNKRMAEMISQEWVTVWFEGKETQALRVVHKAKIPRIVMGGSNRLIAYYLAQEIRGKYVHCVLSFYEDEAPKGGLAPFVAEVLSLERK
ncbi:MAG: hypothetical protein MUE85_08620 [Microscillaceae bacterium]|jgi:hypothetical protein|nr:hypothetical protein [Microscillaceae bacterium]